jgi:hypothetical protein
LAISHTPSESSHSAIGSAASPDCAEVRPQTSNSTAVHLSAYGQDGRTVKASCSRLVGAAVGRIGNRAKWAQEKYLTRCIRFMTIRHVMINVGSCDFPVELLTSM